MRGLFQIGKLTLDDVVIWMPVGLRAGVHEALNFNAFAHVVKNRHADRWYEQRKAYCIGEKPRCQQKRAGK